MRWPVSSWMLLPSEEKWSNLKVSVEIVGGGMLFLTCKKLVAVFYVCIVFIFEGRWIDSLVRF